MDGDGVRLRVGLGLGVFDGSIVGLTEAVTVQICVTRLLEVKVAETLFESSLFEVGTSDIVPDDLQAVSPVMSTMHRMIILIRSF
jgi:hypothetical protein